MTKWRQSYFDFDKKPEEPSSYVERILSERKPAPRQRSLFDEEPKPVVTPVLSNGHKGKAHDLLEAIRTLKRVESEKRPATEEEKQVLARFSGFGPVALSIFPDPVTGKYKDGWESTGEELKGLLTDDEYASAKRTTFNQFFTSPIVMEAMHDALEQMGVPPNGVVLEPGAGIGNFMCRDHRYIGVELDGITGRIARLLHPDADIRIENFRDTKLPQLDGVIGNVPFADIKLEHAGHKFSLHDYFFAKSVDALKPGGVLALVTSHFTLDKQNAAIREYLADKADFVGAIRLPSEAFKREGTSVVTDIIFLKKRASGEVCKHCDPEWIQTSPLCIEDADVAINRYFLNHPEMVLGNWSRKDTLYGEGYNVTSNGELADQLKEAIGRLPKFDQDLAAVTSTANFSQSPQFTPPPLESHITEGSFFVNDGTICQFVDGQAVPVEYGGTTLTSHGTMTGKRFAALIGLRDRARRVLRSQNEGWPESDRQEARKELNWAYDRFVSLYGPINKTTFSEDGSIRRMPNIVKFREDPDAMLVLSLEEYDETTGRAAKAAIMHRDVVGTKPPILSVTSAEDGLLVSLDRKGVVDLPYIASLYGKPEQEAVAELGDLIFLDPESSWQTADAYLSGNVRHKLKVAEAKGIQRNVNALQAVQPEDVLPGDIDANLGAPWVPVADVQAFATELFSVPCAVSHMEKDAMWSLDAGYAARMSVAASSDYGTPRANGTWLMELALNMKTPVIYDPDPDDPDKRVVNQEETLKAKEKQRVIKEKFKAWVFADPDRTERLVRIYNDTYNNLRPRIFDGSHLHFPGMSQAFTLRQHQKDAVWRGMSAGNTLLAQIVGAGKTAIMAATAMKMKQAGLIKKPMVIVPNHLLEQFAREFLQVYPNAKLLVATKDDLARERRKLLTAKIATGDWDAIIMTHSSFERIGMSRDYQERFLRKQIEEYNDLLLEHAKGGNRNIIKAIEKQKAAREERLKDLLAEDKKDDGLVFDELGVDHIFVDESNAYKNMEIASKMERVAGIQPGGSERAFDMFMKAQYLHEKHPGHGVTFASGTPISNSMVEMYTLQRFLDPDGLTSRGIEHFDAWAATFGEVIEAMEIAPDGRTLKPRSRFSRFMNLPELQQMFRSFADVQTADMLQLPRPALKGGKAQIIATPMSEDQRELQAKLVERYERLRSQKVDPREDNALAITTDGRKLALDARMLIPTTDDPHSKISRLVEKVHSIWKETVATRRTQMIFCDMGVNPTPWKFSAYEEIVRKLTERGIPPNEIALVGDADSDAKKQALFEKVRQGSVRVLIGSTARMGTGTNVQKRLIALHHLDAPWKPSEVEQREGRILRQGNENPEVQIYRYVTEGSFDAFMWQALETKARFISQIMTGKNMARKAEDIGGQELSYAEVKAIASGNPAVLTLAEADAELQRLNILRRNHADEQFLARRNVRALPDTIARMKKRLSDLTADAATAIEHADDPMVIGKTTAAPGDEQSLLAKRIENVQKVWQPKRVDLGTYRGLTFGLLLDPSFPPDVFLEGKVLRRYGLSEHHGPRAVLNALGRLAGDYGAECEQVKRDLAIAETQLRDYLARMDKPFAHTEYLNTLTSLRDQLKAGLSGTDAPVREIAEQIKALRETNAAEVAQGTVLRQSAEEMVTAPIQRKSPSR